MDKQVFFFQDVSLDAEKALHSTLKLIVGADGLSMIALGAEQQVLALESIRIADKSRDNQSFGSELQDILSGSKLLAYRFNNIRSAISVPLTTLVPNRLFSPEACRKYFQLLQGTDPETIFGHDEIKELGCHVVWGALSHFHQFVNRYQPRHLAITLIRQYLELASPSGYSIFVNIRGNYAQITVFELRKLVFYNTFEFNKAVDLLYYVLLVFDQFKLNPEQVPLQVSGRLFEGTEAYKTLHKYVQTIAFLKPVEAKKLPAGENALPDHYWFDLLSL